MKFLILLISVFFASKVQSSKKSLLNPPWKHCVHRSYAKKVWQDFSSPGFPHGITTQTQCSWIINSVPPNRIKLAFHTMNITGSVNNCFTQFIEIWEINTGSSMGRFCGDKRPGDYVSYGDQIRVDLKADTAATIHEGFLIKYKATKERGGFKRYFSFTKRPPKRKSKGKNSSFKPPSTTGGRVNLVQRKLLRNKKNKKKKKNWLTKTTKKPQSKPKKKVYKSKPTKNPRFVYVPKKQLPPPRPQPPQPKNKNNAITINARNNESSKLPFQLWVIIAIAVGGAVVFIVTSIIIWLCFCRKPKDSEETKQNLKNRKSTEIPLNSNNHPIRRLQDLPGSTTTTSTIRCTTVPQQNTQTRQAPALNYSQNRMIPNSINQTHPGSLKQPKPNTGISPATAPPAPGGYLFYCPTEGASRVLPKNNAYVNTALKSEKHHKEFILNRTQSNLTEKKKVPTLKRKFSQWEKEKLKNGTLRM